MGGKKTGSNENRRLGYRTPLAVCYSGHSYSAGEVQPSWEIKCPQGHWTWEDGHYCWEYGVPL